MAAKTAKQQAKPLRTLYFLWVAALLSLASDLTPLRSQEIGVPKKRWSLTAEDFRALGDLTPLPPQEIGVPKAMSAEEIRALGRQEFGESKDLFAPQEIVDKCIQVCEWVLRLKLTDRGRREAQQLYSDAWRGKDKRQRNDFITDGEGAYSSLQASISSSNQYEINIYHDMYLELLLERLRNSKAAIDRWWVANYESIYGPGEEGNPVLVPGDPPLTQQMVNRYCAYVELAIDLSRSGGLTGPEREVLKGYLVTDWQRDKASKQEILAALKEWHDNALNWGSKPPGEYDQCLNALRSRFLAHLSTHSQEERNQWLLQIDSREQLLAQQAAKQQELQAQQAAKERELQAIKRQQEQALQALKEKARHDAAMRAIDSIGPYERRWP